MSEPIYSGAAQYNLIYIFAINDEDHRNYLKIGQTSFSSSSSYKQLPPNCEELNQYAHARIKQYTKTALVKYELLYTELARVMRRLGDGTIEAVAFSDHDVHQVLNRSGYVVRKFIDSDRDSEWYRVTLAPAIAAIRAVREGRNVLTPAEKTATVLPTLKDETVAVEAEPSRSPFIPREEQIECVAKTKRVFAKGDKMLWDCKMRFGKTVTAYKLIKDMGFQKVIVVTHRPAVVDGWSKDFDWIFAGEDRVFLSKADIKYGDRFNAEDAGIDAENNRKLRNLVQSGKSFIYFASMQDLRGSKLAGGPHDKNRGVFEMDWDLIIYDEAHEGTQTELGLKVQELLEAPKKDKTPKKVLQLSGTPYNLLSKYDDNNVYSWDYVKEQKAKAEWDSKHPGDHNPYEELPEMRICTFDLRDKLLSSYRYEDETVAFNFREFFRTWTGDPAKDFVPLPAGASVGDFVHAADVDAFLDLISTDREDSNYPFATEEYREMFRHTFWILPGVKEARAFCTALRRHPVFKNYEVVNVAGEGDVEQPYDDALIAVRDAIKKHDKTITVSCGRLTTGVTVREWSGVMLLSGSSSTGAAGYMQTIFRVQSAGSIDGKQKKVCYAFDFAPDRALKVLSEVHQLKKSAVGTDDAGRVQLREFLNFCPVLAEGETGMEYYDVDKMMRQLKRLTVDAAVKSGFDDDSIYKADAGIVMDTQKARLFEQLKLKLTPQKPGKKETHIKVNEQGLTEEEYRKAQEAKRKNKKERTKEEEEALKKEKEQKKSQQALFDLLRNVSIRLPLLIYGTAAEFDESIKLEDFITVVDNESWKEFMPKEVDKEFFCKLLTFYDEDVIAGAGMRIRRLAKAADEMPPTERVKRIAEIFSYFRNPAKETVLTPWRVVNMHMGDTIGGYSFYKEGYPEKDGLLDEPRLIDQGKVTVDLFLNENVKILEMNSKSGLYPLYVAYSIYRILLPKKESEMTLAESQAVWDKVLSDHLYVLCQTSMAVSITKRTLAGYRHADVKAIYLTKLLERMKNQQRLANKLSNPATWGKEGERVKFDAIVGNPPYQLSDGGGGSGRSASSIYPLFVTQAKQICPAYFSMIMPSRWFNGGKGLDEFRENMLNDERICKIVEFEDSKSCFPTSDISGGICFLLWDRNHVGKCRIDNVDITGNVIAEERNLSQYPVLISNNRAIHIVSKVRSKNEATFDSVVSSRRPFGLDSNTEFDNDGDLILRSSSGLGKIKRDKITSGENLIFKWKVITSKVCFEHGGIPDKDGKMRVLSVLQLLEPNAVCTETYLVNMAFDDENHAKNLISYLKTKFVRFLLKQMLASMNMTKATYCLVPVQDFSKPWTDKELYEKYNLTEDEIDFIESMIKPME